MSPLSKVGNDVGPRGPWHVEQRCRESGAGPGGAPAVAGLAVDVGADVGARLFHVVTHIKSVARRLGNGDAVVEGEAGGDGPDADDDTPTPVGRDPARGVTLCLVIDVDVRALEGNRGNESDEGRHEQPDALHREYGRNHGAAPTGRRESDFSVHETGSYGRATASQRWGAHSDVMTDDRG